MLDMIFSEDNLRSAMEHLLSKKDSCGIDGIKISQFEDYWNSHKDSIIYAIKTKQYMPDIVEQFEIINYKGKRRVISKYTSTDRFLQRAIYQVLNISISTHFHQDFFAYQNNKNIINAVERIKSFIEKGMGYVIEIDIENCFDNINLNILTDLLDEYILEDELNFLIQRYLYLKVRKDFEICNVEKGILQGSPLSPLLCNIYFNLFDWYCGENEINFIRYGDDIKVFCETYDDAVYTYKAINQYISEKLLLNLNMKKSGIYRAASRIYFGYKAVMQKNCVQMISTEKKKIKVNEVWNKSSLEMFNGEYHIVNDRILTRKDFSLLFENKEAKILIPPEVTDVINIYSDIILTSSFVNKISNENIKLNIFDKYSRYIGSYIPKKSIKPAYTLMKQITKYNNYTERLRLAKSIVIAGMQNIRSKT